MWAERRVRLEPGAGHGFELPEVPTTRLDTPSGVEPEICRTSTWWQTCRVDEPLQVSEKLMLDNLLDALDDLCDRRERAELWKGAAFTCRNVRGAASHRSPIHKFGGSAS